MSHVHRTNTSATSARHATWSRDSPQAQCQRRFGWKMKLQGPYEPARHHSQAPSHYQGIPRSTTPHQKHAADPRQRPTHRLQRSRPQVVEVTSYFCKYPAASGAHPSSAAAPTNIASASRQRAPTACAQPPIRPRHSIRTHSNRRSQPHHDSTDQRRSHPPHPTSRRAINTPRSAKPQPRSPTVPITPLATTTAPRSSPTAYPPLQPPNIHNRPAYTPDEYPDRALGWLVAVSKRHAMVVPWIRQQESVRRM